MKIYLAQINPTVGDLDGNCEKILGEFTKASEGGCDLLVFSEMVVTGYPCEDLWQKKYFLRAVEEKISEISVATKNSRCAILLGAPTIALNRSKKEIIQNSALLIEQGEVKKIIGKKNLPNFGVFDEQRYFEAQSTLSLIEFRGMTLAILICEDLWDAKNLYLLQEQILDAVIVLNASPYSRKKHENRLKIATNFAAKLSKPLIYVNQVGGQDSLVFDGSSFAMNSAGKIILQMREFEEDFAVVEIKKNGETNRLTTYDSQLTSDFSRHYSAVLLGLRDYIHKNNFKKILLGMSGGIDSALVATIAVDALGSENVSLYALPSRYNSESSMIDAKKCAENLAVNLQVISIEPVFESMLLTLRDALRQAQGDASHQARGDAFHHDVMLSLSKHNSANTTEENLQSRIRGNMLMALSNGSGALLLSTGNKSELAVGYATIYGDMCGAFNPIKDLYKTEIYELAKWRNENFSEISFYKKINLIPKNILTKAPTAELRPNQKDSDSLPEYEILDKILFALIEEQKSLAEIIAGGFAEDAVKKVAKLFYDSEYKRRQATIGVKVSDMSFDKDRRYPITSKFKI